LKQALSLHRRAEALHRELQLADLALVKDCSEANLGRLKDIQAQLSALGGIEAAREDFGRACGSPGGNLVMAGRAVAAISRGGKRLQLHPRSLEAGRAGWQATRTWVLTFPPAGAH
jgi:hypothetical protein